MSDLVSKIDVILTREEVILREREMFETVALARLLYANLSWDKENNTYFDRELSIRWRGWWDRAMIANLDT